MTNTDRKALKTFGIEIVRNVYEESNDYGDKAGDVYWIVQRGLNGLLGSDPICRRWQAVDAAIAWVRELEDE